MRTFSSTACPLRARSEQCYEWPVIKRQPVDLALQHLNHFKFFCDQLHIFRKMTFGAEKSLMLSLSVFKA